MLKGIPKILSPELLKVLCEMGHSDRIVIAFEQLRQSGGLRVAVIVEDPHEVGSEFVAFAHTGGETACTTRILRQRNDGDTDLVLQREVAFVFGKICSGIVRGGVVDDDEMLRQSRLCFQ